MPAPPVPGSMLGRMGTRAQLLRWADSYTSLLLLLLANFFLLELVEDGRWGAFGSTLLSVVALVVAISDPDAGTRITRRHAFTVVAAIGLSIVVLFSGSARVVGLTYLLPVALLVTATLPVTFTRIVRHRRVTWDTVIGSLCIYVLLGLLFAFVFLAVDGLLVDDFFRQPGPHDQSAFVYFSFVTLTTLGFGDLSPVSGLPQAIVVIEALLGQVFLVTLVARLVALWVRQDDPGARR